MQGWPGRVHPTGTPLEGTPLPMRSWFTALYLLAVSSSSVKLGTWAAAKRPRGFSANASAA